MPWAPFHKAGPWSSLYLFDNRIQDVAEEVTKETHLQATIEGPRNLSHQKQVIFVAEDELEDDAIEALHPGLLPSPPRGTLLHVTPPTSGMTLNFLPQLFL